MVVLLVPAAASAQPSPDPPPPGQLGSDPTKLKPDARAGAKQAVPPPPPAPRQQPVAPAPAPAPAETPEPQIAPPAPRRVSPVTIPPAGRPFGEKPERRAVSQPERPRVTVALPILSTDSNTHAYLIAALSLVVLALGSGTLLTVLARLRSTRQGLV